MTAGSVPNFLIAVIGYRPMDAILASKLFVVDGYFLFESFDLDFQVRHGAASLVMIVNVEKQ